MQVALLLKYVEQSRDSHHLTCSVNNHGFRNTKPFGAFASDMVTLSFCTAYGDCTVYSAMSKSPGEVLWGTRDTTVCCKCTVTISVK